jgi:hypothetical protein
MKIPNYCVITLAKCESAFMANAMQLTEGFKNEIEKKANPISIRYGIMTTGQHAGSIAFFQNYTTLSDFEKSFSIYQESDDYKALFTSGNAQVVMRNIVKYIDIPFEQKLAKEAKYLVLTRVSTAESMEPEIAELAHIFSEGGALTYRFGNLITGNNVGNQLLGVTYSSMAEMEKIYDILGKHDGHKALLNKVNVNMRNIINLQ